MRKTAVAFLFTAIFAGVAQGEDIYTAKVAVGQLNVRAGEGSDTPIVGLVRKGQTFVVAGPALPGGWVKITLSSGKEGYVWGKAVTVTKEKALPTPAEVIGGLSEDDVASMVAATEGVSGPTEPGVGKLIVEIIPLPTAQDEAAAAAVRRAEVGNVRLENELAAARKQIDSLTEQLAAAKTSLVGPDSPMALKKQLDACHKAAEITIANMSEDLAAAKKAAGKAETTAEGIAALQKERDELRAKLAEADKKSVEARMDAEALRKKLTEAEESVAKQEILLKQVAARPAAPVSAAATVPGYVDQADKSGEQALLTGVGNVIMGTWNNKPVFKIPKKLEATASPILSPYAIEKHTGATAVYYVIDNQAVKTKGSSK